MAIKITPELQKQIDEILEKRFNAKTDKTRKRYELMCPICKGDREAAALVCASCNKKDSDGAASVAVIDVLIALSDDQKEKDRLQRIRRRHADKKLHMRWRRICDVIMSALTGLDAEVDKIRRLPSDANNKAVSRLAKKWADKIQTFLRLDELPNLKSIDPEVAAATAKPWIQYQLLDISKKSKPAEVAAQISKEIEYLGDDLASPVKAVILRIIKDMNCMDDVLALFSGTGPEVKEWRDIHSNTEMARAMIKWSVEKGVPLPYHEKTVANAVKVVLANIFDECRETIMNEFNANPAQFRVNTPEAIKQLARSFHEAFADIPIIRFGKVREMVEEAAAKANEGHRTLRLQLVRRGDAMKGMSGALKASIQEVLASGQVALDDDESTDAPVVAGG